MLRICRRVERSTTGRKVQPWWVWRFRPSKVSQNYCSHYHAGYIFRLACDCNSNRAHYYNNIVGHKRGCALQLRGKRKWKCRQNLPYKRGHDGNGGLASRTCNGAYLHGIPPPRNAQSMDAWAIVAVCGIERHTVTALHQQVSRTATTPNTCPAWQVFQRQREHQRME